MLRLRRTTLAPEERRVVDKAEQWTLDPAGGVRRMAVPVERRRAACLPRPWWECVARMGLAAEWLFGRAQDVEWAIADRQVWLLQSRPITGLAPRLRAAGVTFWEYWGPEVVAAVERLRVFLWTVDEAGDGALAEKVDDAFGLLRRHWGVHALLSDGADLLLAPYYAAYAAVT